MKVGEVAALPGWVSVALVTQSDAVRKPLTTTSSSAGHSDSVECAKFFRDAQCSWILKID